MFRLTDPPPFVTPAVGWPIVLILFLILCAIILVGLRRQKIKEDRKRRQTFERKSLVEYMQFDTRFTEELFKKPGSLKGFPYTEQEVKNAFTNQSRTNNH